MGYGCRSQILPRSGSRTAGSGSSLEWVGGGTLHAGLRRLTIVRTPSRPPEDVSIYHREAMEGEGHLEDLQFGATEAGT